jgi:hypothetical protein
VDTPSELTEFEQLLRKLEDMPRAEIAELVMSRLSLAEARRFIPLATGLSLDALRFVSARTLLRKQPRAMGGR